MRQIYIKELSAYSIEGLKEILGVSLERAAECVEMLTTRGVLRLRSGSDENEFDTGQALDYKGKYQFVYVGLTIIGGKENSDDLVGFDGNRNESLTIVVYPKYMDERDFEGNRPALQTREKLRQVFRVLRKSSGSYSDIATLSDSSRRFNDRIACMLMLLEMYAEYGTYSNYIKTFRANGSGDISWERTISFHQPYLQDSVPVYFEYETISNTKDDADFITRIHKCILEECSEYMHESGVADILGLEDIELTDEKLDDLGDIEHLQYRLDRERGVQYVTWKQDVIDLMRRYLAKEEMLIDSDEVICLGTTSFYHVWEKACKVALGDLLDVALGRLGFALMPPWKEKRKKKLIEIVPRPQWYSYLGGEYERCHEVSTLVPDTISVWTDKSGYRTFGIFDAKYYTPKLNEVNAGVPGVESVTKQVLYQQAYRQFVEAHHFDHVANVFVVPGNGLEFELMGKVEFPGVFAPVDPPFVNGVKMWKIPAGRVWQCYLSGETLSHTELGKVFG